VILPGKIGTFEGQALEAIVAEAGTTTSGGGTPVLRSCTLSLPVGPIFPFLAKALIENQSLRKVVFHFVGPGADRGDIYRLTLEDVHVSSLSSDLPDTRDPLNAAKGFRATVNLVFPLPILVTRVSYIRGDATGDGKVDISDPIGVLAYLFQAATIICPLSGDANGDGRVDISDAIGLLSFLFQSGSPPRAPFPGCGAPDPDVVPLPCGQTACGGN
jgi:type VI protein secretion system component Hcp